MHYAYTGVSAVTMETLLRLLLQNAQSALCITHNPPRSVKQQSPRFHFQLKSSETESLWGFIPRVWYVI